MCSKIVSSQNSVEHSLSLSLHVIVRCRLDDLFILSQNVLLGALTSLTHTHTRPQPTYLNSHNVQHTMTCTTISKPMQNTWNGRQTFVEWVEQWQQPKAGTTKIFIRFYKFRSFHSHAIREFRHCVIVYAAEAGRTTNERQVYDDYAVRPQIQMEYKYILFCVSPAIQHHHRHRQFLSSDAFAEVNCEMQT